ncbi:DNA mismatch repair endonuclease MutL [Sporosalibacterium faouarense]|uniref:DNA mismatch repair endonuclease MutL n=1 Tax=Sporosalibacterium faouarense TaxID=516123 RepID=UPI00192BD495|nr:DNA mismatch repair endonuclease MutL [Sporosalibacterium faouarense]
MSNLIKRLDEKTINKIAAGEVVERPSSVIKELVENSIDANSTSIIIEIKAGGKKYIRVTDNGSGINRNDLDIAFLRHSTSKINSVDDLEVVRSLGFRGEALASISAVSLLEIVTKTQNDATGTQANLQGGQVANKKDVGCPNGTTIIVKNLFYNVPVRKKFLKSDNAEGSQISNIVYKLALSNPNISFKYIKDNKLILKTPGNGDMKATIYSLFGKEFTKSLFKINYNGEDIKIKGMISNPSFTRGNRGHQYLFVNGRYIKDDNLSKVVEDAYKSLIPINRFPIFIIFLELNGNQIDVNVHPTKTEIRFDNANKIYSVINNVIKDTLKQENLIPEISIGYKKKKDNGEQKNFIDTLAKPINKIKEKSNIDINNVKRDNSGTDTNESKASKTRGDSINQQINEEKLTNQDIITINYDGDANTSLISDKASLPIDSLSSTISEQESPVFEENKVDYYNLERNNQKKERKIIIPELNIIGNLFDTYILAQDKVNEVFYMIDQHAAHERIMYEKLRNQFNDENVVIQELLAPNIIELTHSEVQLINENIKTFEKLGFLVESFGTGSIILRGVPLVFGEPDSKKLFLDILDNLNENIGSGYDLRVEKIMKMACTSAIKAGHQIKEIEVSQLISDLRKAEQPFTCPHGRPIIVKMTKYELEKKFKRVM